MADEIFVRMRFDHQDGNLYYFIISFWNDGLDLTQYFGAWTIPAPFSLDHLSASTPRFLPEGMFVGAYEVPEDLVLIGCKGNIYPSFFDLIGDLVAEWEDSLGLLLTTDVELVYAPSLDETKPEPYLSAYPLSEPAGSGSWLIPVDTSDWPATPEEGTACHIAGSVSLEGCVISPTWAHLYTGEIDEKHIIFLLGEHPNETIDPPEPDIDVRFWGTGGPAGWGPVWGSYDTNYPEEKYDGWNGPTNGRIECLEGLFLGYAHPISTSSDTILPFLSPLKAGEHASVTIPFSYEPFFFFPDPYEPSPNLFPPVLSGVAILVWAILNVFFTRNIRVSSREVARMLGDSTTGLLGDSTVGIIGGTS